MSVIACSADIPTTILLPQNSVRQPSAPSFLLIFPQSLECSFYLMKKYYICFQRRQIKSILNCWIWLISQCYSVKMLYHFHFLYHYFLFLSLLLTFQISLSHFIVISWSTKVCLCDHSSKCFLKASPEFFLLHWM